eukprot:g75006.t1
MQRVDEVGVVEREVIRDLLSPQNVALRIREKTTGELFVPGLEQQYCSSVEEILELIKIGEKNRKTASTNMNETSSRSHSVFIVVVTITNADGTTRTGKLNLADLAGSERVRNTGATGNVLEEAKKINQSLSALGNCINALTDSKRSHIPFRDSTLTFLLKDSLGGNTKTMLVVCCSSESINAGETLSTLRFAQRAKRIKNTVYVNKQLSVEQLTLIVEGLRQELAACKIKIKKLRNRVRELEGLPPEELEKIREAKGAGGVIALDDDEDLLDDEDDMMKDGLIGVDEEVKKAAISASQAIQEEEDLYEEGDPVPKEKSSVPPAGKGEEAEGGAGKAGLNEDISELHAEIERQKRSSEAMLKELRRVKAELDMSTAESMKLKKQLKKIQSLSPLERAKKSVEAEVFQKPEKSTQIPEETELIENTKEDLASKLRNEMKKSRQLEGKIADMRRTWAAFLGLVLENQELIGQPGLSGHSKVHKPIAVVKGGAGKGPNPLEALAGAAGGPNPFGILVEGQAAPGGRTPSRGVSKRNDHGSVLYQSVLWKKPSGLANFMRRPWQQRLAVLRRSRLEFYDIDGIDPSKYNAKDTDASTANLTLDFFIDLSGSSGSVVVQRAEQDPPHCFNIITPKAEHSLHAQSKENAIMWVDGIRGVIEEQQHYQKQQRQVRVAATSTSPVRRAPTSPTTPGQK